MPLSAEELIDQYIELGPEATGPADARLVDTGVHVWALIGYLRANSDDSALAAADYDLPLEAIAAARAYYARHRDAIDAVLALQASSFAAAD